MKHSKAPWFLDRFGWITNEDGDSICLISRQTLEDQEKANSNLLLKSPELLEMLEIMLHTRISEKGWGSYRKGQSPMNDRCYDLIVKAGGKPL